jgi:hypothetical protein
MRVPCWSLCCPYEVYVVARSRGGGRFWRFSPIQHTAALRNTYYTTETVHHAPSYESHITLRTIYPAPPKISYHLGAGMTSRARPAYWKTDSRTSDLRPTSRWRGPRVHFHAQRMSPPACPNNDRLSWYVRLVLLSLHGYSCYALHFPARSRQKGHPSSFQRCTRHQQSYCTTTFAGNSVAKPVMRHLH